MADLSKIVDELSSLTVLEAAELAKMLEEKWGVSAAAAVAVAAGPGAAAAGPATATAAAAETPHFSSRSFASSAASSTVRLDSSSTILLRSAMSSSSFYSVRTNKLDGKPHAASPFEA